MTEIIRGVLDNILEILRLCATGRVIDCDDIQGMFRPQSLRVLAGRKQLCSLRLSDVSFECLVESFHDMLQHRLLLPPCLRLFMVITLHSTTQ